MPLASLHSMSPNRTPDTPGDQASDDLDDADVDEMADVDEADDNPQLLDEEDDQGEGEIDEPSSSPQTLIDRLTQRFSRQPASSSGASRTEMTDNEKAVAIRQVDQLERRVGYLGAVLGIGIGLAAFLPFIVNPKKKFTSTITRSGKHCLAPFHAIAHNQCSGLITASRSHWVTELAIVVVFAAFLVVATRYGRRSLVAFALLFMGLALLDTSIIALLYVGAGGWLLVRAYRVQKYGTTNAKEVAAIAAKQREERKAGRAPSEKSSARSSTGSAKSGKNSKGKKATPPDTKPRPEANKRYTPKTPPRKRPVPPAD